MHPDETDNNNDDDAIDDGISSDDLTLAVKEVIKVSDILKLTMKNIKKALRAKFDKDTEMARLLKATNMAKLVRFRRNKEPLVDTSLMEVRAELNELQK